ncbi:toll/interleukin-1 receptor domain-containing protein [Variovorax sp. J22P240]|uniref:toll/interleukin-1 receptor domain-containing protein n=1 Tax=Variovorax sp. J22P240 TaxID=3053514 RepID=UPI0025775BBB|nr:toll/interleukin-1 receptor domain-containing protein [Variovorax sp. J22P240]MDM0002794.1 toll/interleukin-1 receptor domain-containing protein [Variovorax sp. J22P240]
MYISVKRTVASTAMDLDHDAFISYSRKDKVFAAKLELALESYAIPKGVPNQRKSRLSVFRDEDDFTGTEYYRAIERHLAASRTMIVICSPAARASRYVNEEIQLFAKEKGADLIIPVLLSGIANNEATSDQEAAMAFPDALVSNLKMPLASSYRGFNPDEDKIDKGAFKTSWFSLLAISLASPVAKLRNEMPDVGAESGWFGSVALPRYRSCWWYSASGYSRKNWPATLVNE